MKYFGGPGLSLCLSLPIYKAAGCTQGTYVSIQLVLHRFGAVHRLESKHSWCLRSNSASCDQSGGLPGRAGPEKSPPKLSRRGLERVWSGSSPHRQGCLWGAGGGGGEGTGPPSCQLSSLPPHPLPGDCEMLPPSSARPQDLGTQSFRGPHFCLHMSLEFWP